MSRLSEAIRKHVERSMKEAQGVVQLATVLATNPWSVQLLESGATLDNTEIDLSQEIRRYHTLDTIDAGDTVVVVRKHTGGEIHWVVLSVLADKTPT